MSNGLCSYDPPKYKKVDDQNDEQDHSIPLFIFYFDIYMCKLIGDKY